MGVLLIVFESFCQDTIRAILFVSKGYHLNAINVKLVIEAYVTHKDRDQDSYRCDEKYYHTQIVILSLVNLCNLPIHDDNEDCHYILSSQEEGGQLQNLSLILFIFHHIFSNLLEFLSRYFLMAMNGPKSIGFFVDFILVLFEIPSLKIRHDISQIIIIIVFLIYRGLCRLETCMIILSVQCSIVLITIVVFVSVNERYRIRSIHKLLINIDAWL